MVETCLSRLSTLTRSMDKAMGNLVDGHLHWQDRLTAKSCNVL